MWQRVSISEMMENKKITLLNVTSLLERHQQEMYSISSMSGSETEKPHIDQLDNKNTNKEVSTGSKVFKSLYFVTDPFSVWGEGV